jgi:hypothetical protein
MRPRKQSQVNNFIYSLKICIEGFGSPEIFRGSFLECEKEYKKITKKINSKTKNEWLEFSNPMPILIRIDKIVSVVIDEEINTPQAPYQQQYYDNFFNNSKQVQNTVENNVDLLDNGYK